MQNSNITDSMLRELLDRLKARGFNQSGVSIRIGWDEKGYSLSSALKGLSQKKLKEAYLLIQKEFSNELGVPAPDVEVVTMRTLNEKLDRILELLNKT